MSLGPIGGGFRTPGSWNDSQAAYQKASDAAGRTAALRQELDAVTRRLDRLSLACQSLWDLAHSKLGLTEAQLLDQMEALDLRDGQRDERIKRVAAPCGACGRMVGPHRVSCVFCGAPTGRPPFQ